MKDFAALLLLFLGALVLGAKQERERLWWWYSGQAFWKRIGLSFIVIGLLLFSLWWLIK